MFVNVAMKGFTICFRATQCSAHDGENLFVRRKWPRNLELNREENKRFFGVKPTKTSVTREN